MKILLVPKSLITLKNIFESSAFVPRHSAEMQLCLVIDVPGAISFQVAGKIVLPCRRRIFAFPW